jgi:hypothetical protein
MFMGFMNVAEIPSADGKVIQEASAESEDSAQN